MVQKIWQRGEEQSAEYDWRNSNREKTLVIATMSLVDYFINLGDNQVDAKIKVTELSTELSSELYAYVLGNIQPVLNLINATTLTFMTIEAKEFLISKLTVN